MTTALQLVLRSVPTRVARARLAGMAALLCAVTPLPARADCSAAPAQFECDFQGQVSNAATCLSQWAATFAEGTNVYDNVKAAGAGGSLTCSPFSCDPEDVMPLSYESPASIVSAYRSSCVDEILDFSRGPGVVDGDEGGRLLYEASFRRASAHGMFGDDRLVRALNLALDPGQSFLNDPIKDSLLMLDSRVCQDPANPAPLGGSEPLCRSNRDCLVGKVCAPARFDDAATGLFGAIQEYRRAEQTLLEAVRDLGEARFRAYDLEGSACGGVGCAAKLLVRLGALRARAQAERIDLAWARAAAAGGGITSEVMCAQPVSSNTLTCALDRDCDSAPGAGDGSCGSGGAERAQVALREEAAEAAAEAGASLVVYQRLAPGALAEASSDVALLRRSLEDIESAASRSLKQTTPFGLPANYVPFLSDSQKELLGCGTSNFACLEALLDGGAAGAGNVQGVLDELEISANQAPLNLDAYADAIRNDQTFTDDIRARFEDTVTRMLGPSCETSGCTCPPGEESLGLCVTFQSKTWVIAGAHCSDASDPFARCSTANADGAFEQQLQVVHTAEVALENIADKIARNVQEYDQTMRDFLTHASITSESCAAVQASIVSGGNQVSSAIQQRIATIGNTRGERIDVALGVGAAIGDVVASIAEPWKAIGSAISGGFGIAERRRAEKRAKQEKKEDLELQIALNQIDRNQQLEIHQIQCDADLRLIAEVTAPQALRNIESQRLDLIGAAREQQSILTQAEIAANQLVAEVTAARQRYDEAQSLQEIWSSDQFRNPQNYRALALENQLKASSYLRRARLATWMLLRSTAYDLAQPDVVSPIREIGPAQIADVSLCVKSACSISGESCIRDSDCTAGVCQQTGANADVADSDGSCSLQAVFAARDAEDLRSLVRRAFSELAETDRDTACNGTCYKTVSLKNIFGDPLAPNPPALGDTLVQLPLSAGSEAPLDFAITLQRDFQLCPLVNPGVSLVDRVCQSAGVAGLLDDQSGTDGETAANDFWNARLLGLKAQVVYRFNRSPEENLCRNPLTGTPVPGLEHLNCSSGQQPAVCIPNGCQDALGNAIDCECAPLFEGGSDPVFDLVQVGPGLVRTRLADETSGPTQPPRDALLRFQMWRGDLPSADQEPRLRPFQLTNIPMLTTVSSDPPDDSGQGVPVASPQWQLRLKPSGLALPSAYMAEYLTAIDDIRLSFTYEAFNLP